MKLYTKPEFDYEKYSYLSAYSSILFIPLSYIIHDFTTLPYWFSYIILIGSFISCMHHLRPYGQKCSWCDLFYYLDITIVYFLCIYSIYLFFNSYRTYIYAITLTCNYVMIRYINNNKLKTQLHTLFHLIVIYLLIKESFIFYPKITNSFISLKYLDKY